MVFLFFTITSSNLFINGFRVSPRFQRIRSFLFRSLNASGLDQKSKGTVESVRDLASSLNLWLNLSSQRRYVVLVFNALGNKYRKRRQERNSLLLKSLAFFNHFHELDKPLVCIVANNALAFNGCKTSNLRRKKRRFFNKHQWYCAKYKKN